jgi:hypothetical protein
VGLTEGLFPLLIGIVCWVLYTSLSDLIIGSRLLASFNTRFGLDLAKSLNIWALIDLGLLIFVLVIEGIIRTWVLNQRRGRIKLDSVANINQTISHVGASYKVGMHNPTKVGQ